jgi:hypothetical protein
VKRRDLGIAAGGAAAAAIVVIASYEGGSRLSAAGERSSAEQSERYAANISGNSELGQDAAKPAHRAHVSVELTRDISELNRRLYAIEKEKTKLQAQLARAERELARQTEGGAARARHEFDLDEQDWRELAQEGSIKYRRPCLEEKGWKPRADELELLGLGADDGETLRAAFRRSYDRIWKTVRPLCARVIGDADVVDSLGPDTCIHVVVDAARRQNSALSDDAIRQVAETRAGLRPLPQPGAAQHSVFQMFWMLTGEMRAFEADLAESFGPEEAKRVAYAKALCHGHSTFGGAEPRKLDQ